MLFGTGQFVDFGPPTFGPGADVPICQRVEGRRGPALRAQLRVSCPRKPGVYGMVNEHGELIYVGKAKNLRVRLLSYFRTRGRPRRATRIIGQAEALVWEPCPSEFAALLRELELIRRWRPRWNVQGQPLRRRNAFICLGRRPAPYVFLTPRPPRTVIATFGPIPASRRAFVAVTRINDLFQLRDCPQLQEMVFPNQKELFVIDRPPGCLRFEIGTCLGPCTGTCARKDYSAKVREARSFLGGECAQHLQAIEAAMQAAAQALEFERAAALRDKLEALSWLTGKLDRLRQAREKMSFVYPLRGVWYLIHAGRVVKAIARPAERASARVAREVVRAVFGKQSPLLLDSYEFLDGMALVMAWFRKYPKELKKTLSPEAALALCP